MGYEEVQNFVAIPGLPDIVSYILIIALYITIIFVKAFAKRDGREIKIQFNSSVNELKQIKKDAEKELAELKKEREELTKMREALKIIACNSPDLVSNGTAKQISQMFAEDNNKSEVKVDGE